MQRKQTYHKAGISLISADISKSVFHLAPIRGYKHKKMGKIAGESEQTVSRPC